LQAIVAADFSQATRPDAVQFSPKTALHLEWRDVLPEKNEVKLSQVAFNKNK